MLEIPGMMIPMGQPFSGGSHQTVHTLTTLTHPMQREVIEDALDMHPTLKDLGKLSFFELGKLEKMEVLRYRKNQS